MKILNTIMIVLSAITVACGCGNNRTNVINPPNNTIYLPISSDATWERQYYIVKIDGCEYVYIPDGNSTVMSHKGNCSNPMHVYNIEKIEKDDKAKKDHWAKRVIEANKIIDEAIKDLEKSESK